MKVDTDLLDRLTCGSTLVIRCPFHSEATGSLVVYLQPWPQGNLWRCFGCGREGQVSGGGLTLELEEKGGKK